MSSTRKKRMFGWSVDAAQIVNDSGIRRKKGRSWRVRFMKIRQARKRVKSSNIEQALFGETTRVVMV
jgi:hypothetical protein